MITFSMNATKSFVNVLKALLLSVLTIFIFNSCKKEILTAEIPASRSEIAGRVNVKIIDYKQFLSSIQLQGIGKLQEVLTSTQNGSRQINTSSTDILSGLDIDADSVKRLAVGDTVSYILRLSNKGSKSAIFHNLTLQQINGVTKAFITIYKPTKDWIDNWKKNRPVEFNGLIRHVPIDLNGNVNTQNKNDTRQVQSSICTPYTVYIFVDRPCNGTGDNMHWPGEPCQNDGGPGAPYVDVIMSVAYECGGGGGGNGDGGGGSSGYPPNNTTPTPPENYDPCSAFSETGEEFLIPCGSEGGSSSDIPDYNYDPTYQHLPNRYETVFHAETGQYYTYGQIEDYYNDNPDAVEELFAGNEIPITVPMWGITTMQHIAQEAIYLKAINPSWSNLKIARIATWNVLGGTFHFALDLVGMVPVYGEAADILNGTIYFVEGNYIDAALSASAAVPVYGWVSTGGKWLRKAAPQLTKPVSAAAGKVAYVAVKNSRGVVRFIKIAVSTFSHSALATLKAVKPADNTLTNLSRTMIDQLSLRIKPTAQSLKNKIDDIVQNGDAAGTKTEALSHEIFATNGFVKHEAKIGSNNGFDGVYIKKDGAGNVQEIIINEAKQVGAAGNIKLNAANANTGLQAQMSDAWVNQTIDKLKNHPDYSVLGNLLFNNKSAIKKTVTGVDKASGDIVVLKLSAY